MVKSMTGFAALKGAAQGFSWAWDIRSVNARGLDVRMRLPDWLEGLDQAVRAAVSGVAARGNVTVGLKLTRDETAAGERIDPAALNRALAQLSQVSALPALALNLPEAQGSHTRFVVCVGPRVWRLPASHVRMGLQTRFDSVVSFLDS